MTDETFITCTVNGAPVRASCETGASLLHFLRNRLGLRGAKFGCGEEQCGACMVEVDGRPVMACGRLAETVTGSVINTIEGVGEDDSVVTALLTHQAGQCGYCLPGIVMSLRCCVRDNPGADRATVAEHLRPHFCRCGAHPRILRAAVAAATRLQRS